MTIVKGKSHKGKKNQWLKNLAADETFNVYQYLERIKGVNMSRKFTRETMNKRKPWGGDGVNSKPISIVNIKKDWLR